MSICDARVCVLFASSRSCIVFNQSADAMTNHSQSAKNIDQYFKSQLYVKDSSHRKPVLILPNRLSQPGERLTGTISRWVFGVLTTYSFSKVVMITKLFLQIYLQLHGIHRRAALLVVSRCVPCMGYIACIVTGVWCKWGGHARCWCICV